ncbi:hypothetical protein [Chondromyces apiculatus]|uniref:Outer membrane protein beta-barrel domain-containing protein n=1 Tax=Chondromyces apiculatus DSM 436 TaxID=1192034 RepID=A0A017SWR3_9BACT|nr:hypothetical protein [Chondromyces apiculatus]EYF01202.1 Hypothetical protein CAP_8543 [Chondromyces apiculatus DSM 436]
MKTVGLLALGLASATALLFVRPAHAQTSGYYSEYMALTQRELPPADEPLIRTVEEPSYAIEGGGGVLGYLGGAASVGPAWTVRFSLAFSARFAGELGYTGATSATSRPDENLHMAAFDASARFNILRADEAPVQPFVAAGLGYAGFFGDRGDPFTVTVPVAAGAERLLTENVKIAARFNVRPAFFDELGSGSEVAGADTWQIVGQVGGAF